MDWTNSPLTVTADLAVAGGGLPGLCAAVAAARCGARVVLVQDRPVLGGNASSEIRVPPGGAVAFNAWAMETGIIDEILLEYRARADSAYFSGGTADATLDLFLYEFALREPRLQVLLNTSVRAVEKEGAAITALVCHRLTDGREVRMTARQFVDATGDGTVAALAGAAWRYGRESREQTGECLAPAAADAHTLGASIMLLARDIGTDAPYTAPPWAHHYETAEEIGPGRDLPGMGNPVEAGFWWMEICAPYHQLDDYDDIRQALLSHLLGVWDYIKNRGPQRERARTYALEWVGMLPGRRESRRILGDVILREQDCLEPSHWPDTVGYGGWYIDLHVQGGFLNKQEYAEIAFDDPRYAGYTLAPVYPVPLRALFCRDADNLWLAGRCMSATHIALGSLRLMNTLSALGQAAGTAAALALSRGLTPRQTVPLAPAIAQRLLRDGVRIPGTGNRDGGDLARQAFVEPGGGLPLTFGEPLNDSWDITDGIAQVFPSAGGRLKGLALHLHNPTKNDQTLRLSLEPMANLWDQHPAPALAEKSIAVPAGFQGWFPLRWDVDLPAGQLRLALFGEGVRWSLAQFTPPACLAQQRRVSPGGCEPRNADRPSFQLENMVLPAFDKWLQPLRRSPSLALRLDLTKEPYGRENLLSAAHAPDDGSHLWQAEVPCEAVLTWAQPVTLLAVHLYLDAALNRSHGFMPARWVPPGCARDLAVEARVNGSWRSLWQDEDNRRIHLRLSFPPVTTDALRLTIRATHGGPAGVYGIRAYGAEQDFPMPE